jgi:hypothetical protein
MKSWLMVGLFLLASTASICGEAPETAATASADHWLSLIDAEHYGASWDEAAPLFKGAVGRDQWEKMLKNTRAPLGKLLTRTVKSAVYKTSLPGAPDGRYVVIQYQSSFEHKQSAVETVTPSQGSDGQWRISGYYIR